MNKEPETYEELIRYKRCVDLTSHYELSQEELDKIYTFLETYPDAHIAGNDDCLTLTVGGKSTENREVINAKCIDKSIDGLILRDETVDEFIDRISAVNEKITTRAVTTRCITFCG